MQGYDFFSSDSSNDHIQRRPWDIDNKDMVFDLSVFLSVSLNYHFGKNSLDIDCKDTGFYHCIFSSDSSNECIFKCFFKLLSTEKFFLTLIVNA